ncbi:PREDICTED: uncharacterized protein LOC104993329 [Bison bison bison]|uniref:Ran-specific GTPase-activating protein n=1 Tax=Bison bison bison TaxID=43346 RepID=A0A6P3HQP2_BISBB|nr:PREDICTED: uncharacterized protein LOC104993329 [Bison bison bison]
MGLLPPVTPMMELKPNAGSDRAWVWNTHADFADECPKQELLAIRFLNAENAQKFKTKFEECRKEIEEKEKKGAAGLWVGALQTHSAPSRSPRRVLFPSATGTCGGCDLCPVTGSTATPVHGCFLGVGWLCLPGAVGAWGVGRGGRRGPEGAGLRAGRCTRPAGLDPTGDWDSGLGRVGGDRAVGAASPHSGPWLMPARQSQEGTPATQGHHPPLQAVDGGSQVPSRPSGPRPQPSCSREGPVVMAKGPNQATPRDSGSSGHWDL